MLTFISEIVRLFFTIDNVSKTNEENDGIIARVVALIQVKLNSRYRCEQQKSKKIASCDMARAGALLAYQQYLESLQKLVSSQLDVIDQMNKDVGPNDFWGELDALKNEIHECSISLYNLDIVEASHTLDDEELMIYRELQLYNMLDIYYNVIDNGLIDDQSKELKQSFHKTDYSRWKTFFYLYIATEWQKRGYLEYAAYLCGSSDSDQKLAEHSFYNACSLISRTVYYKRRNLNLTQEQLAARSGVNRSMIAKIERLQQPTTLETAAKLLSVLNMCLIIAPMEQSVGR